MTKTVLITGASSGIGKEFAEIFAHKHYNLILVARKANSMVGQKQQYEDLGCKVVLIGKDLSEDNAAELIHKKITQEKLHVDILINNAGFGLFGEFKDIDMKKEEQMIHLNILTLTKLTKLFVKDMLPKGKGKILNVASTAAFFPGPLMSVYFATKAYVLSFTEGIAKELEGTGVTVTALCPGPTESHFQKTAHMEDSKLVKGKKLPSAKEVAEFGYTSLMKGKVVAVHGTSNKLLTGFVRRFTSRKMMRNMLYKVQEKENKD